jgi:hypothetical protein
VLIKNLVTIEALDHSSTERAPPIRNSRPEPTKPKRSRAAATSLAQNHHPPTQSNPSEIAGLKNHHGLSQTENPKKSAPSKNNMPKSH